MYILKLNEVKKIFIKVHKQLLHIKTSLYFNSPFEIKINWKLILNQSCFVNLGDSPVHSKSAA